MGARPHDLAGIEGVEHIAVRADTLAWNKENLINLGIQRSRYQTPYIAWWDADIEFRNRNVATETVHALQQYRVVQPWTEALDLGPRDEAMEVKGFHVQTSFAKVWRELGEIKAAPKGVRHHHKPHHPPIYALGWAYPHPGYAWAARRDVLERCGGLIEASGLGAGDHQMAMAFVGHVDKSIHGGTHATYQAVVRAWAERAHAAVQGDLGYVEGRIEHWWHGDKARRKYQERWDILIEEGFNPLTDLRRNLDGVIELADNKPRLRHRFDSYYRQRDEDANVRTAEDAI